MNNQYLKRRLLQSTFLFLFFLGMSATSFAQSDSGSASGSGGNGSCPCPCLSGGGGGSDSGSSSGSGINGGSDSGSSSSSGGVAGDPCNCCVPDEVCPTPIINTPISNLMSSNGNFCQSTPVTFFAPNLGFPCLEYTWNFGDNASPSTFVGRGPIDVTFFTTGNRQISLTIDNNCANGGSNGGNGSGSDSGSGIGGSGSGGSNSSSGEGGSMGGVICSSGGNSSGGSGSDSGSTSGSGGIGGSDSGSNSASGSGGNGGGGNGGQGCITCRRTVSININIDDCNQPNGGMIGDMVFNDLNGNGVMNNGEPGIQGITVTLSKDNGQFVDQQTSDFFGKYKFNVMPNMSYKLTYSNLPAGFSFAPQNQGGNEENDSDANPNSGMTDPIFINPGDMRLDQDVGLIQAPVNNQGSVGDRVFADNNGNGVQDNGEPGIGGVTVKLQNSDGTTLQTTTTNGSGNYTFTGLDQGLFKVMFNTPNGFTITMPKQGGNDDTDSDVQNDQMTNLFFLGQGDNLTNIDAGYQPDQPNNNNARVGDRVFADNNNNGQQDNGEPGIGGVTVKLQDANGNVLREVTTNGSGNYEFTGLASATYKVMFNTPNGFTQSPADVGNDATDSDNQSNQMTNTFFLADGENNPTIDAGFVPNQPNNGTSVGDKVFADNNGNGIQDSGEPGIGGVTVKLQTMDGTVLQTTTTDGNGNYSFTGLSQGMFKVMFNTPNGFTITMPKQGGNDNTDSDVQNDQMTNAFFVGEGQNLTNIDAGYQPDQPTNNNARVGDKVFSDNNNNGQQDNGEPGIGGVTVKLQDANGNVLREVTTNGNGNYEFTGLASATYKVMFNTPAGFNQSPADVGNDATDSDNQSNQMTNTFFLADGENNPTIDAGFVPQGPPSGNRAKVGNFVFRDNNANGLQDNGEPGIQGVFVALYRSDDSFVAFQLSGQDGMYMFGDLDPGSYKVKFVGQPGDLVPSPQDQSSNDNIDSDINFLGFTPTFNLSAGETNLSVDAGFAPSGPPPATCTITASVSNMRCDGSTYSFDVTVNGSNTGDWGWDLPEAGIYTQPYGSTRRVSGVSGTKTFVIVDHDVAGCETTITVNSPSGCNTGGGSGGTGTCSDINFSGANGQITISGLTAAIEITKIFDASWNLIYECSGNCPSTVQQSVSNGDYNVQVQFYTAQWGFICEKQERVTVGGSNNGGGNNGGGDNGGGNNGGGNNGGGSSSGDDCNNINVQSGNGQITVSGWSAPVAIVKIFNPDFSLAKECTGNNCAGPITASGLGAGRYHIDIQLYTAGWQSICTFTQDVNMGGSSLIAPSTGSQLGNGLNGDFEVYPNPVKDELFVHLKGFAGKSGIIQVHNQIGQVVEQVQLDKIPNAAVRIALDKLQGGLYYISAQVEGGQVMTKKVIIE